MHKLVLMDDIVPMEKDILVSKYAMPPSLFNITRLALITNRI